MEEESTYQLSFEEGAPLDDYRNANCKVLKVPITQEDESELVIRIKQNFHLGKGGILWDASYIMAQVLQNIILQDHQGQKIKTIQLGAGSGLPSILLAKLGHSVVCTDLVKVMPLIEESFALNEPFSGTYDTRVLEWGNLSQIEPLEEKGFDYIIAADVIYLEETFQDLIFTFKKLSCQKTKVLISFRIRLPSLVEQFLQKLIDEGYEWAELPAGQLSKIHPNLQERFLIATRKQI